MTRVLMIAALLATLPTLAASADKEALMLELFQKNGCKMSGADAARILPENGFSRDEAKAIEKRWIEKGWIDTSQLMSVTLTKKACKR